MRLLYSLLFSILLVSSAYGARNSYYTYTVLEGSGFTWFWNGNYYRINSGWTYTELDWGGGFSHGMEYNQDGNLQGTSGLNSTPPTYGLENFSASFGGSHASVDIVSGCDAGYVLENSVCVPLPAPTCDSDTQFLDSNNTCQNKSDHIPSDFPNDDTGFQNTGYPPVAESGCNAGERYNTDLGVYELLGWDYQAQKCLAVGYKCKSGRTYDADAKTCVIPPDNTGFGDNLCVNDNWARKWTHDFCSDCTGDVGIWLPPLGHEESGMECNRAYVEYQCVKDYRIKKYKEVSCGDPLPVDSETHEMDISPLEGSTTNDTNTSSVPDADSGNLQNHEDLESILDEIEKGTSELKGINQNTNDIKDGVTAVNDTLGDFKSQNHSDLTAIKDAIDGIDINVSGGSDTDCMSKGSAAEIMDCLGSNPFPSDFMSVPTDWYDNSKIGLDITFGSSCQLETFTWNIGGEIKEFPPKEFIESLPLETVAGFFIALLYIGGLREFLKS